MVDNSLRFEGTLIGGEPINRTAVDRFTLLHILSGFVGFFVLRWISENERFNVNSPLLVLTLAIAWEIFEPMAKDWNPDLFPNPSKDSPINKTFDVIGTMLGYYLAKVISK
jgi:hypothetical protein